MSKSTVAAQIHQALDVHADFTAQIALDRETRNGSTNTFHFSIGQIPNLHVFANFRELADFSCSGTSDTVNGSQGNDSVFLIRNIDAGNASHPNSPSKSAKPVILRKENTNDKPSSALPLLVAGIRTNDPDHTIALDQLAIAAHGLNRRSNFHDCFSRPTRCLSVHRAIPCTDGPSGTKHDGEPPESADAGSAKSLEIGFPHQPFILMGHQMRL
jgi:hypothetical protein